MDLTNTQHWFSTKIAANKGHTLNWFNNKVAASKANTHLTMI